MNLFERAIEWVNGKFVKTINHQSIYGEGNIDVGGGGGGFEPTTEQLAAMNSGINTSKVGQIETNKNGITNLNTNKADKSDTYTKTETDDLLGNKLDLKTTAGANVYSHNGETQDEMSVKTTMSDSPSDSNLLAEKGIKTYVDSKSDWKYVGLLGASSGATLTVKDDWKELLIIARLQENSYYYNDGKIIPKVVFTQGAPTNNNVFIGFYWNDNYTYKARIGLYGSGTSRYIKNDYPRSDMWVIAGFYIYKR